MAQFPPALQFSGQLNAVSTSLYVDTTGYSSIDLFAYSNTNYTADLEWSINNGTSVCLVDYTDTITGVGTLMLSHQIRSRYVRLKITPSVNPQNVRYSIYLAP